MFQLLKDELATESAVGEKVQNNSVPETEGSGLWDKEFPCT